MILLLYKSLVRPVLEYENIIWGPYYIMGQKAVEKIQCRAINLISELKYDSYQERLFKLSLPSLVYRRSRGDMIFLYQLTNQYFNIDANDLFKYQPFAITRGHK